MSTTDTPRAEPDPGSFSHRQQELTHNLIYGDNPIAVALMYLVLLGLAEVVTVFLSPHVGMVMNLLLLLLVLAHAAVVWQRPIHRLLIGLAFVPLIRAISLSLPLAGIPLIFWYFATSVPLFAAIFITLYLLNIRLIGALPKASSLPVQLSVALTGILLGYVEYRILQPQSLIVGFSWGLFLVAAVILLISTGYVEELVFRRVMQRTAVERFGRLLGIFYVSLFFAILHLGYRSFVDFVFVFVVGFAFGLIVARTGSLLGVTLSHGLTNIMLFLVIPHMIGGDISIPGVDPIALGLEAPAEVQTVQIAESPTATPSPAPSVIAVAPLPPTATMEPTATRIRPTATPTNTPRPSPTAAPSPTATPTARPKTVSINYPKLTLLAGPHSSYPGLGVLSLDEEYEVRGRTESADWWLICCLANGQEGWMWSEYADGDVDVSAVPVAPTPLPQAIVAVGRLNVRSAPYAASEVIGQAELGSRFEILARDSGALWLQICCVDGQRGWLFTESVAVIGDLETLERR